MTSLALPSSAFASRPDGHMAPGFIQTNNLIVRLGSPTRRAADSLNSAVREPATWSMMIAGFGLIGAAMRRRSTVSAVRFVA